MKEIELTRHEARKIILASQGLKSSSQSGKSSVRLSKESIESIGYVQIDTISVVQRAHHHVWWSRVNNYHPELLAKLEQKEKVIFEYWSHAASYLPMIDYRFTLPFKKENKSRDKFWYRKDKKIMQFVMDRIKAEGPLMSKNFEKPAEYKSNAMWEAPPTKQALQNLFMEGEIMVAGRQGFQKIYDLTERVLPANIDLSTPSYEDYLRHLIFRDLKAHGIVRNKDIGYLLKGHQKGIAGQINEMTDNGEVIIVKVKGKATQFFSLSSSIDLLEKRFATKMKFLSPFDNVLINRERTSSLFDYDYTLECYTPAAKRRFGYFGLPILWNNDLIGQIDVKADRTTNCMIIRNLTIEKSTIDEKFIHHFRKALLEFMVFNRMDWIKKETTSTDLSDVIIDELLNLET